MKPKGAADLAREDAMREWQEFQGKMQGPNAGTMFGLSTDFFNRHPEVSGGVFVGPNGPQFLFSDNKPKDMIGLANDLIRDYTEKIQSGQAAREGRVGQYTDEIQALMQQISGATNAQTAEGKAPSEIAMNTAAANRPQVVPNVATGPEGAAGSFLIPPGGQPQPFASGSPAISEKNTLTGTINTGFLEFMKESARIDTDPLIPPEQKAASHAALQERFRNYFNTLQQLSGKGNQPAAAKPNLSTWLAEARRANPGKGDDELTKYFNEKYGR